ncbi:DNA gyrase inhibitor YacG [Bdellovibrio sp. 22V]|uniref:DNA gyrase inhibitor YacG n=1 Tax=Bdellovibrio TaxID=958 RepID=UPI002542D61A|nr:DNA gyrase inhibitor YacG [Bdellovibrio sp. 22V]WII73076.1 DNA gyrase inhibitor YacG [Bdellovibrio sp. 22V]
MAEPSQPRQVKCPQCGRLSLYSTQNPYRPFCSERCRLIDLGAWASEAYKIPVKDSSSDSLSMDENGDYSEEDDE